LSIIPTIEYREVRHAHLFAGLGGGARGFNRASPRVGNMQAKFRCLGGIDVDPAAVADFERLTGTRGTVLDLFDRAQYVAWHGREPGEDWREATPDDIRAAFGGERPHIIFTSPPCKGFSGLLSEGKSKDERYQALNRLTTRGLFLALEAFADDPPELVILENVPRIMQRGRWLLDQIGALLRQYGYAVAETTHDCGEIGGLAQSRKRFLLVARHMAKVPPFLYQPEQKKLRAVGDVLGRLALPGDERAGAMHRVPALQWQTWVRLAFVEAGKDWRSLNRLQVEDGKLRDYLLVPEALRGGAYGVAGWGEPMGTVAGESLPSNGKFAVADPRFAGAGDYGQLGVRAWADTCGTVIGVKSPIQGGYSVADPRPNNARQFSNIYRVTPWDAQAGTITGQSAPHDGAQSVADPRPHNRRQFDNIYRVVRWDGAAGTVIGRQQPSDGAQSVADPRIQGGRQDRDSYRTAGCYGVLGWNQASGAVSASGQHDNGNWSVADPRPDAVALPLAKDRLVARIISEDGTWHRPFTTLELAALQSLVDPEEHMQLEGLSDQDWRERIGNAVPPDAAQAIAETMGRTLLLAWSGEGFMLSATPIWVRPVAVALSVAQGGAA